MSAITVPLSKGMAALVDEADYTRVVAFKWSAAYINFKWYGIRQDSSGRMVYLHRFILDAPKGIRVDHVDGDGLNCTRQNMRLCTQAENNRNRKPNGARPLKGIRKAGSKYIARIGTLGGQLHLGTFETAEEAGRAYDTAARQHFGEFARCNFPEVI